MSRSCLSIGLEVEFPRTAKALSSSPTAFSIGVNTPSLNQVLNRSARAQEGFDRLYEMGRDRRDRHRC